MFFLACGLQFIEAANVSILNHIKTKSKRSSVHRSRKSLNFGPHEKKSQNQVPEKQHDFWKCSEASCFLQRAGNGQNNIAEHDKFCFISTNIGIE